jgi:ABC-type branched-subunit amino acid transport system permease subunit
MELDVRLPMGVMFVALGAVLIVVGLVSDAADNAKSLGYNVNLWWGIVMAGLGAAMLALVWHSRSRAKRNR